MLIKKGTQLLVRTQWKRTSVFIVTALSDFYPMASHYPVQIDEILYDEKPIKTVIGEHTTLQRKYVTRMDIIGNLCARVPLVAVIAPLPTSPHTVGSIPPGSIFRWGPDEFEKLGNSDVSAWTTTLRTDTVFCKWRKDSYLCAFRKSTIIKLISTLEE